MPKDETLVNTDTKEFLEAGDAVLKIFVKRASVIFKRHWVAFAEGVANSETKKGKFNFVAAVDMSEPELLVHTGGRWAETHIEGADDTVENPMPPMAQDLPGEPLPGLDEEAKTASGPALKKAKEAKRKGRKLSVVEVNNEGQPESAA